jgi:hypothetical protein
VSTRSEEIDEFVDNIDKDLREIVSKENKSTFKYVLPKFIEYFKGKEGFVDRPFSYVCNNTIIKRIADITDKNCCTLISDSNEYMIYYYYIISYYTHILTQSSGRVIDDCHKHDINFRYRFMNENILRNLISQADKYYACSENIHRLRFCSPYIYYKYDENTGITKYQIYDGSLKVYTVDNINYYDDTDGKKLPAGNKSKKLLLSKIDTIDNNYIYFSDYEFLDYAKTHRGILYARIIYLIKLLIGIECYDISHRYSYLNLKYLSKELCSDTSLFRDMYTKYRVYRMTRQEKSIYHTNSVYDRNDDYVIETEYLKPHDTDLNYKYYMIGLDK